ncbi:MAG: 23S rRNA (guanosine(2251)-2'-O)-methyltransferase RlmB [Vicinamibacterales bacterium]
MIVFGINPVLEALKGGRARELRVAKRADERLGRLLAAARERHVPVRHVSPEELDRLSRKGVHQGVAAEVEERAAAALSDLLAGPAVPLLVVLDGVEDPHNLGAIARSVDAAGAGGLVVQERRSAALDGVAVKASAGALNHVPVAEVVNIARAIEELKASNVWVVGLAGEGDVPYTDVDFTLPTAIVLGAEGQGLRRLVRERCDRLARIPLFGQVESLNVSVAAGIVLFEAVRQRTQAPAPGTR